MMMLVAEVGRKVKRHMHVTGKHQVAAWPSSSTWPLEALLKLVAYKEALLKLIVYKQQVL